MAELFPRRTGINVLADATIRMIVAFVAGELAEQLVPLSRRFVPEPEWKTYIVTHYGSFDPSALLINYIV